MDPICDLLVVDSGGFIKNAPLQNLGKQIVTLREVVSEIRDKATKERLQVLPYELEFKEPDTEDIRHVTEFSKKTGDYHSLSAVDMKVLSLTLAMERRLCNGDLSHLNAEPRTKPTVHFESTSKNADKLPGFYLPEVDDCSDEGVLSETESENEEKEKSDEVVDSFDNLEVDNGEDDAGEEEEEDGDDDDIFDDEDDGWITPANIKAKRKMMNGGHGDESEEQKRVRVACMTTDFAMQNVLKQLGLNVISMDGLLIRETRTWILRCYACFHTTTLMHKTFCPKCGNKTLKRVSVTLNADGSREIHINGRRPLNTRGKRFSLPKPKGGKKAVNPVLCEDQSVAQMRASRIAKKKTDALHPDYIAGESPFVLHDVTSKSSRLGIDKHGQKGGSLYWNKKNPNASGNKTGNRKKKKA